MEKITATRVLPFPKNEVWEALADFGKIDQISPGVKKSYLLDGPITGVGAKRHCDLVPFGTFRERITDYRENERMVVEIYEGKKLPPIKNISGIFKLDEAPNGTKVSFIFQYEKKGFMGSIMNPIMIKPQMTQGVNNFLKGLEHFLKTGRKISKQELKKVA